jgi:hypothetical protein
MSDDDEAALRAPSWPPVSNATLMALVQQCIALAKSIDAKVDRLETLMDNVPSKLELARLMSLDAQIRANTGKIEAVVNANPLPTEE